MCPLPPEPTEVHPESAPGTNPSTVSLIRVINEVIVGNEEQLDALLESLAWLRPDAIKLEAHRYLVTLDVACDDTAIAPGYCQRRIRKAAIELGIVMATGEQEIVGVPAPA